MQKLRVWLWENRLVILTGCFILIAFLLVIMPPEKGLGNKVRLVYFHASIAENSIIFFVLSALVAVYFLISSSKDSQIWSSSAFRVAFYLWIIQTILGGINMKIIWGEFFWSEPKARMGLILLAVALVVYVISEISNSRTFNSILYILTGASALVALFLTSNVFHPSNAIFGSNVLAYKVIFVLLAPSFFIVSFLWTESVFLSRKKI